MTFITLYTGKRFDPVHPDPDLITITDISHCLSLLCRGNGHLRHFYSVAQHSICCAGEAAARGYSSRVQMGCLLHDASEAYMSDVTRPVKSLLPLYFELEDRLQTAIWTKFMGTPPDEEENRKIFEIDDDMLFHEFHLLMPEDIEGEFHPVLTAPDCAFVDMRKVEEEFCSLFRQISMDLERTTV